MLSWHRYSPRRSLNAIASQTTECVIGCPLAPCLAEVLFCGRLTTDLAIGCPRVPTFVEVPLKRLRIPYYGVCYRMTTDGSVRRGAV